MNKKTVELEEKKNELMSQLHLLQEKTTEMESQLTSQEEENTTEVTLVKVLKGGNFSRGCKGSTLPP